MPKWQDFLLARGRYQEYRMDFGKKSKIDWGAKMLCHFFWFQFLGSAGPKNGRIQKKWVAKFFYYYCVSMRPKLKKVVYITMPKNLIFHFLSKTPILAKKGPPVPLEGSGGEIWLLIGLFFTGHSYKPIKSKIKNFCWPVHACIYVRSSVNIAKLGTITTNLLQKTFRVMKFPRPCWSGGRDRRFHFEGGDLSAHTCTWSHTWVYLSLVKFLGSLMTSSKMNDIN